MIEALFLFRTLPDHAGKPFQRHQRLAGIGPFLQLLDGDMIERLPAGAPGEQRARDVHHVRRARAFVKQWRAASRAKASHGFGAFVLEAGDAGVALGNAKTLAPASDIGGVGGAMRAPAARRMIVPGPARGRVDLEADAAAQALTGGDSNCDGCFWHFRFLSPSSLRGANATKQSILLLWLYGLLRCARNDVHVLRPAPIHREQDNRYSRSPRRHRTSPGYTASTEIRAAGGAAGPDWR